MEYVELKQKIEYYNGDDGFELLYEILDDSNCDLALALEIFFLADGYVYLENSVPNPNLKEWCSFVENLYYNILKGKYIKTQSAFEIPLNKVQKYKLSKKNVPAVFLMDL